MSRPGSFPAMRASRYFLATLKEAPSDAELVSHKLMVRAGLIRQITVGRGLDPRQFSLVAFGGAGPMHAVFLAEELGIETVLVPQSPGTFSAHGMLESEIRHDLVHPYFSRWDRMDHGHVGEATAALAGSARQLLKEDGIDSSKAALATSVDLRYVGQEHFLTLPAGKLDGRVLKDFHRLYKKTVQQRTKFKVHDEKNECGVGDLVRITETRPISKEKRWRVLEIVEKAK